MITKNETSNFPLSFEEVDQLGLQTYSLMQRDAVEFSLFGIDQIQMDSFKALSDSFNKRDFDEQFVLKRKEKTFAKSLIAEELRTDMFDLSIKVDWAWREKQVGFKSLKLGSISKDSDSDLATKVKLCVSLLSDHLPDFVEVGITAESLQALSTKVDNLRQAIDEQSIAEHNRHIAQSNRIAQANELYSETMKYRTLGRKMWATTDYERSQSYVMPKKYSGSGGSDPDSVEPVVEESTGENSEA